MAKRSSSETAIGVTAFKAQCLALIDAVARGKTRRIVVLKHDRPIAAIVPFGEEARELWRAMTGSVKVSPNVDLTERTGEIWKADS